MNSFLCIGRACEDARIKYLENGRHVTTFKLAVDRGRKNPTTQEWEADFFRVTHWGWPKDNGRNTPAERTAERVKKGLWVGVKGAVRINVFTNAAGEKKVGVDVEAEEVRVLDYANRPGAQAPASELAGVGASGPAPGSDLDDEIPF